MASPLFFEPSAGCFVFAYQGCCYNMLSDEGFRRTLEPLSEKKYPLGSDVPIRLPDKMMFYVCVYCLRPLTNHLCRRISFFNDKGYSKINYAFGKA